MTSSEALKEDGELEEAPLDELISDSVGDRLIQPIRRTPRRVGGWFLQKGRSIVRGLTRVGKGIVGFIRSPGDSARNFRRASGEWRTRVTSKLRREMDRLTWVQLIAVIGVFAAFLILPLLSVIGSSFYDPYTGAFSLSHFARLFRDSNIWPWVYNPATDTWLTFMNLDPVFYDPDLNMLVVYGWDFGGNLNSI